MYCCYRRCCSKSLWFLDLESFRKSWKIEEWFENGLHTVKKKVMFKTKVCTKVGNSLFLAFFMIRNWTLFSVKIFNLQYAELKWNFSWLGFKSKGMCLDELRDSGYKCNKQCYQMRASVSFKWPCARNTGRSGSGKNQKSWFFLLGLKYTLRTCFESKKFLSKSCPELSNQVLSFSEGQIYLINWVRLPDNFFNFLTSGGQVWI